MKTTGSLHTAKPAAALLALLLMLWLPAMPQSDDKSAVNTMQPGKIVHADLMPRYAILIGNAKYQFIGKLGSPELDVDGMYNTLLKSGFQQQNILRLKNLTKSQMDIEIGKFVKRLPAKCWVVFYYSGHGVQFAFSGSGDASNFLLPVDIPYDIADVEIPSYSCNLDYATRLITRQNPDGPKIFILDACRSNPLSSSKGNNEKGLADIGEIDNTIIGYAAEPGKTACDGGAGNMSPYTQALIEVMQKPGLKLEEVFSDVRNEMIREGRCRTASHASILLNDDYFFIAGNTPPGGEGYTPPTDDRPAWLPETVHISGVTFTMGSDESSDEYPHQVTLSNFRMKKTETTNAEYCLFLNERGNQTEGGREWINLEGSYDDEKCRIYKSGSTFKVESGYENYPVIYVSWYGAKAYCDWLSGKTGKNIHLPTEAQWEYAAGNGSKHTKYSWGNGAPAGKKGGNVADESAKRKYSSWEIFDGYDDGYVYTAPVGKFEPNEFGLYDMSGNVWEWCQDWYATDFYKTNTQTKDPCNTTPSNIRVVRGGSWINNPSNCRVAFRNWFIPNYWYNYLGFRFVQDY